MGAHCCKKESQVKGNRFLQSKVPLVEVPLYDLNDDWRRFQHVAPDDRVGFRFATYTLNVVAVDDEAFATWDLLHETSA